jgi:putative sterol carrier protein
MSNATREFFDELAERKHEPLLENARGTVRFDLVNNGSTERWLVDVDKGDIAVSKKNGQADAILRTDKALFDGVATGEVNAMAAVLRGAITLEGNWELLVLFQRLFPAPNRDSPLPASGSERRK